MVGSAHAREPDVVERPKATALARAEGAVEFEHVGFAYTPGEPILHDLSYTGGFLGIVTGLSYLFVWRQPPQPATIARG